MIRFTTLVHFRWIANYKLLQTKQAHVYKSACKGVAMRNDTISSGTQGTGVYMYVLMDIKATGPASLSLSLSFSLSVLVRML